MNWIKVQGHPMRGILFQPTSTIEENGIMQLVTHFMSRGKDAIVAKISVGRSPEKITEMMPK